MIGCNPLWVAALAGAGAAAAAPVTLLDASANSVNAAFTYARSGAIYLRQSDGTLASIAANALPRAHDASLGWHYRLDPGWNQLALQTHSLATSWTRANVGVPAQSATGPNGATDAWTLLEDSTATANHNINQSIAFTSGTTYCLMAVAAPQTGDRYLQLILPSAAFGSNAIACFNLATGATTKNATALASGSVSLANGFYLCWVTATATASASGGVQLRLQDTFTSTAATYTGNGTSGVKVWAANCTDTAYAVPMSLATTGSVAIGSPSWTATLAGLGLTLGSGFAFGADAFYQGGTWSGAHRIMMLDDGTAANRAIVHRAGTSANDGALVTAASSDVYTISPLGALTLRKMGLRVNVNDHRLSINGSLQAASGTAAMPSGLTTVRLGHGPSAGNILAGGIARAWISTSALNDAALQAQTT